MFRVVDMYHTGIWDKERALREIRAYKTYDQLAFISQKAIDQITLLEKCYLSDTEKEFYLTSRQENFKMNMDKVKLARKQYRNQGAYIEDILK